MAPHTNFLLSGCIACLFFSTVQMAVAQKSHGKSVEYWLTSPEKSARFQKQAAIPLVKAGKTETSTISINEKNTYQSMVGFGYALTGGSALHIHNMSPAARKVLLEELFTVKGNSIGVSYLRLSIGASDLDPRVFSYDDLPEGETDTLMEKFSLDPDREYLLPVLKEILAINPDIQILGSPWSPPVWMKTNGKSKGGSLKPEYYQAYARYFIKYIQEMKKEGITINAITIQNEPLHPGNNPSMLMLAEDQAIFIKTALGPAFRMAGITTTIQAYDHNAKRPDYPITVLNDPEAAKYVDGSAFHMYEGTVDQISEVHKAHPDKHLYFTEQWVGAPGNLTGDLNWHIRTLIVGATRNWCRNVIEWNLAADSKQDPHTDGGCTQCLGAVTIEGDQVVRNPAYYIIAHASKFVRPGSVRIESNLVENLPNVAFRTPGGKTVLIVQNDKKEPAAFTVISKGKKFSVRLDGNAVGTFVW
ncbi:MAG: glycoside hydrolase family 30 beta sandwich domain-containing protein [Bacteroidales bacterium]